MSMWGKVKDLHKIATKPSIQY